MLGSKEGERNKSNLLIALGAKFADSIVRSVWASKANGFLCNYRDLWNKKVLTEVFGILYQILENDNKILFK